MKHDLFSVADCHHTSSMEEALCAVCSGFSVCKACLCVGPALTTDCCGTMPTARQMAMVVAGYKDYENGHWINVPRMTYDQRN